MKDRRRYPRIEDRRRVSIALIPERPEPDRGLVTLSAEASDVSGGGIDVSTLTPITTGAFVRVDVPIPGPPRRTLTLSGIVRWCHVLPSTPRFMVGIEFLPLTDEDHRFWTEYSKRLLEQLSGESD
jgi:hypothetical protein